MDSEWYYMVNYWHDIGSNCNGIQVIKSHEKKSRKKSQEIKSRKKVTGNKITGKKSQKKVTEKSHGKWVRKKDTEKSHRPKLFDYFRDFISVTLFPWLYFLHEIREIEHIFNISNYFLADGRYKKCYEVKEI